MAGVIFPATRRHVGRRLAIDGIEECAEFSRIPVPQKVFKGVDKFMRSVSSMRGSKYAYTPERKDSPTYSMTAAGLLCRMYLDWDDTNGGCGREFEFLMNMAPSPMACITTIMPPR